MPWHESVIEAELAKTKLLVNASSVGMIEDETPISGELIPPELLVLDLIYAVPQTRLLRDAAAAGCEAMNGELMLLHQSAAAFTLWTGKPAPLKVMQERLDEVRGENRAAGGSSAEAPSPEDDGQASGTGAGAEVASPA